MGFEATDLPFVLAEARRQPFAGAAYAVGFGALDRAEADATFLDFGRPAPASATVPDILRALGFARVETASDLDPEVTNSALRGGAQAVFAAVFDLGASMRAFHIRRALGALGRRVAVGGRIVHAVPSANHIDDGFYMASPRLFHDYYRANDWRIDALLLVRRERGGRTLEGIPYAPGSLRGVAHGGLDDARYRVFCVATRLPESTIGIAPQHGFYTEAWARGAVPALSPPLAGALASWLRGTRWAYRIFHGLTAARKKRRIRAACLAPSVRYDWRGTVD